MIAVKRRAGRNSNSPFSFDTVFNALIAFATKPSPWIWASPNPSPFEGGRFARIVLRADQGDGLHEYYNTVNFKTAILAIQQVTFSIKPSQTSTLSRLNVMIHPKEIIRVPSFFYFGQLVPVPAVRFPRALF